MPSFSSSRFAPPGDSIDFAVGVSGLSGLLVQHSSHNLTPAELRLLRYLPTHLSLREIAEEFYVSTNTVQSQAQAIYRKIEVSSRAEAVNTARAAGLLDE
jgi:DNA-binding CsgD family transcriptional regulator